MKKNLMIDLLFLSVIGLAAYLTFYGDAGTSVVLMVFMIGFVIVRLIQGVKVLIRTIKTRRLT